MKTNENLTVVTVNFNNSCGLRKTLKSLSLVETKPKEIIVIDSESNDMPNKVIEDFNKNLNILFINEKDKGIYDGMNKGLALVKTKLVHYLNSGDEIYGDAYKDIHNECLLPVNIFDENEIFLGNDFIKAFGTGYNHQGIIFSSNHSAYDLSLSIASDRDLIYKHFKKGLKDLQMQASGGVNYYLGGISTKKSRQGNIELIKSLLKNKPNHWISILIYILIKSLSIRWLRRYTYKFRNSIKSSPPKH